MPDFFVRYISSSFIFNVYAATSEHGNVPPRLNGDIRVAYPEDFAEHIISTTERLKSRVDTLHNKYAERPSAFP